MNSNKLVLASLSLTEKTFEISSENFNLVSLPSILYSVLTEVLAIVFNFSKAKIAMGNFTVLAG